MKRERMNAKAAFEFVEDFMLDSIQETKQEYFKNSSTEELIAAKERYFTRLNNNLRFLADNPCKSKELCWKVLRCEWHIEALEKEIERRGE